jgi:sugar-specific transcriptional regulator TrmB
MRFTKRVLIAMLSGSAMTAAEIAVATGVLLDKASNAISDLRANARVATVVNNAPGRPAVYAITPFGVEWIYTRQKRNRIATKANEATNRARRLVKPAKPAPMSDEAKEAHARTLRMAQNESMVANSIRKNANSVFSLGAM